MAIFGNNMKVIWERKIVSIETINTFVDARF